MASLLAIFRMTQPATRSLPKNFKFEQPKSPPVVVNFNGGQVTSDAGLSLIAELDRKLQITSRLARCFQDYRSSNNCRLPIVDLRLTAPTRDAA